MKTIRVGIIGCDTHGMYFGPIIQSHDPVKLRFPVPWENEVPYTWMRGSIHYYFYSHYCEPTEMIAPAVKGFRVTKVWDKHPLAAEVASDVLDSHPIICERFEDVSDDVDLVIISDCNGDGHDHLELAGPSLRKGVPTFLDKPLAHKLSDAKNILKLAAKHKTPLMCLSMLQILPAITQFKSRLEELGKPDFAVYLGCGEKRAGLIHAACAALTVFGDGVQQVSALSNGKPTLHLDWGDRPDRLSHGLTIHCEIGGAWHGNMHLSAYGAGAGGAIHSRGFGAFDYPVAAAMLMEMIKKFVQAGKPQGNQEHMLEAVAICDAAEETLKTGKPVRVASTAITRKK